MEKNRKDNFKYLNWSNETLGGCGRWTTGISKEAGTRSESIKTIPAALVLIAMTSKTLKQ